MWLYLDRGHKQGLLRLMQWNLIPVIIRIVVEQGSTAIELPVTVGGTNCIQDILVPRLSITPPGVFVLGHRCPSTYMLIILVPVIAPYNNCRRGERPLGGLVGYQCLRGIWRRRRSPVPGVVAAINNDLDRLGVIWGWLVRRPRHGRTTRGDCHIAV